MSTTNPTPARETVFHDLSRFEMRPEMIQLLPEKFCRQRFVALLGPVPSGERPEAPLGMLEVDDRDTVDEVERKTRFKVWPVQLNAYEIDSVLDFGFGREPGRVSDERLRARRAVQRLELSHDRRIRFEHGQSVPDIIADILSEAVTRCATDVHIETYSDDIDLRFRVDGVMQQVPTPISLRNAREAVSYLKVLSSLDIINRRQDQDGRIAATYRNAEGRQRKIDLRLSILPGPHGEDVVLRVLDQDRIEIDIHDLGMTPRIFKPFRQMIESPGGILLVTGPTASGKSTTLYAALRTINHDGNKILTVEDPIEYEIPRVNQKQVNKHMTFADYARAFMRQNPDVVMIGEVRDEETASIAVRAAQMGHLVLATLHTRDALSAMARLMSLNAEPSLIASAMLGVLSQRLLRKVCTHCAEPHTPGEHLVERLPGVSPGESFTRGKGCDRCFDTGYHGQIGVYELLTFDDALRARASHGFDFDIFSQLDFETMYDDAIAKARAGVTSVEEILRVVPVRTHHTPSQ